MSLKAYMIHDGEPEECAILAFAHTAREAKKMGWDKLPSSNGEYISIRAKLIKHEPWIFELGKQSLLALEYPHVIVEPRSCEVCNQWGKPMETEDLCEDCAEDRREDAADTVIQPTPKAEDTEAGR